MIAQRPNSNRKYGPWKVFHSDLTEKLKSPVNLVKKSLHFWFVVQDHVSLLSVRNRAGESTEFLTSDSPICDNPEVSNSRQKWSGCSSPSIHVSEDGEPWCQTTRTSAEIETPAAAMALIIARTQQQQECQQPRERHRQHGVEQKQKGQQQQECSKRGKPATVAKPATQRMPSRNAGNTMDANNSSDAIIRSNKGKPSTPGTQEGSQQER